MKQPLSFLKKNHQFITLFFIFYSLFFYSVPSTSAQTLGLQESDISLDILPQNPVPNQTVTLTLDSYATDLNAATITWSVNGKQALSGGGKKKLSVRMGSLGQKTNITISIDTQVGQIIKNIILTPTSVDMLWEANTYTPPFYKGRALFTAESSITYIAVPHIIRNGAEVSAKNLIYKWSNNGTVFGDNSGYGLNTITIQGSIIPRPMDIVVEVTDPVSSTVATGETEVSATTPFTLLYKNDPLYGIQYEKAITDSYTMTNNEINVTAIPYNFSTSKKENGALTYLWEINGVPISDGLNSATKVFRRIGDSMGSSNVSVAVSKEDTIFQNTNKSFVINFVK